MADDLEPIAPGGDDSRGDDSPRQNDRPRRPPRFVIGVIAVAIVVASVVAAVVQTHRLSEARERLGDVRTDMSTVQSQRNRYANELVTLRQRAEAVDANVQDERRNATTETTPPVWSLPEGTPPCSAKDVRFVRGGTFAVTRRCALTDHPTIIGVTDDGTREVVQTFNRFASSYVYGRWTGVAEPGVTVVLRVDNTSSNARGTCGTGFGMNRSYKRLEMQLPTGDLVTVFDEPLTTGPCRMAVYEFGYVSNES